MKREWLGMTMAALPMVFLMGVGGLAFLNKDDWPYLAAMFVLIVVGVNVALWDMDEDEDYDENADYP